MACMRRVVATILWFYVGWYAGNMVAELIGVTPYLGPVVGVALALVALGDPRRFRTATKASEQTSAPIAEGQVEPS
jgi:hypothetical protein